MKEKHAYKCMTKIQIKYMEKKNMHTNVSQKYTYKPGWSVAQWVKQVTHIQRL